jgi:hypothetical protein
MELSVLILTKNEEKPKASEQRYFSMSGMDMHSNAIEV